MVRQSFKASKDLTDETQISNKKADAVRALSNYMVFQSAQTDERLQAAMASPRIQERQEKLPQQQNQQSTTAQPSVPSPEAENDDGRGTYE